MPLSRRTERLPLERRVRLLLRRLGIDVRRWREEAGLDLEPFYGRVAVMRQLGVETLIDVGANQGQYAAALRAAGFPGRICSFEPLSEPFAGLERRARNDPLWECRQLALGADAGHSDMHVAENPAGSSFLPVTDTMVQAIPEMATVAVETVRRERLDELPLPGGPHFLKIDVQGYERWVLEGAEGLLPDVAGIELELSFYRLYEGDAPLHEILDQMAALGYELKTLIPGVPEPATQLPLQVDGIFVKSEN